MDILEKLFGSAVRVKLMKLFLLHPGIAFDRAEIKIKTKSKSATVGKELSILEKIGLIRSRSFYKEGKKGRNGSAGRKRRVAGFVLEPTFQYLNQLKSLLIHSAPIDNAAIAKRITKHGKIKLIVTAGMFIQNEDSRLDLLIVGDEMREGALKSAIQVMESEIGTELRYALFNTKDFQYRLGICDRLVRDVFDYPHQLVVDKLNIENS